MLTVQRQSELIGLARSSYYYQAQGDERENVRLMRLIDEAFTRHPLYGSRRITAWLRRQGEVVNRKRGQRLMRKMGLEAV